MPTHHTIKQTEYWTYNDDPKLPVIIMIHGLRGTHHGLDLVAKRLTGFKIIVPDLPGFGSTKPLAKEHSLENYTNWLHEFITDLGLDKPPVLMGHSFGSIITANYASAYPTTIEKLILVNPIATPALKGPKAVMSKLAEGYYWLGNRLPNPLGSKLLSAKPIVLLMSTVLAKTKDKDLRKWIHNQHLTYFSTYHDRQTLNEAFKTSVGNNVQNVAKSIAVPTLLIAGELDDITKLEDQKTLNNTIDGSHLIVVDNVGHLTQYEAPDKVADAISSFAS